MMSSRCVALFAWGAAAAASAAAAGDSSFEDAIVHLQKAVSHQPVQPVNLDMYVSTADSLEDVMFWAVMYKSMERQYPLYPHTLLLNGQGPLKEHAHAIRMALGQNFWHASVDIFSPTEDLNLASVDKDHWRQLAPFRYSDPYRRIVHISPDSMVFKNIDDMTHKDPRLILAREQGDCKNLTEALASTSPALNLYSMVPDKGLVNMMVPASVKLASAPSSIRANVTHANLLARAFELVHPGMEQGAFGVTEVTSASCLMHHKDARLHNHSIIDNMRVMYWGDEGKKMIGDIIHRGERRLVNTLDSLKGGGKAFLSNAIRTWFELFATDQVRSVIDAAKTGKVPNITQAKPSNEPDD